MKSKDDIFDRLDLKHKELTRSLRRAVILQPGAVGDCILTLPLAQYMKDVLNLGAIDILGHTEYTNIFPDRTCIDGIRSIDSLDLHRLFVKVNSFDIPDGDSLLFAFAGYSWVVTFLGEEGSDFEQNLIYTINCVQSAEVITLKPIPDKEQTSHIAEFHLRQFAAQAGIAVQPNDLVTDNVLLKPKPFDKTQGQNLLSKAGVDLYGKTLLIHPGSGSGKKCWRLGNFLAVAEKAASKGFQVLFLLGPAEAENFAPRIKDISEFGIVLTDLSLDEVIALCSCVDTYIGNDSGITHLAAACGTDTIALFGPTDPKVYAPMGPAVKILTDHKNQFTRKLAKHPHKMLSSALQEKVIDILTN